ncbi:MAG: B12-binding domain-containing radical SAM protein [Candidatus Binatia bacterium]
MQTASAGLGSETFLLELIKPSHYDDDGYVIQWWRGSVPSNSLSNLYGLAQDVRQRKALGPDVDIDLRVLDETTAVVPLRRIIRRFQRNNFNGLVCLVGVQSNQFPRAMDIARPLRAAGIEVAIGGFHVSGCLAMLPTLPADLQEALDLGICLFAGEGEGRFDELLRAAREKRLAPVYDFMKDLPGLESQPLPFLPHQHVRRYLGNIASFDAGRGCPFSCSFCTIINVQGRKSRYRTADDIEALIRANNAQGLRSYFISDDNFARNKNWEPILDRIIELREVHGLKIHLNMQVDTCCHKIPHFIEKAARAGCTKVFIGLENINPDNLKGASKGQNQITEYRVMLQAWRAAKVLTFAGYILGFPDDTPESIERDIAIIQRELPIDALEFFILTPLPGSKDHQDLVRQGVALDPDMNRYDSEHVTTAHRHMTAEQWQSIYHRAWDLYYSPSHIETLMKRAAAGGASPRRVAEMTFYFYATAAFEHVHPLQGGLIRRKLRRQRRSSLPRENVVRFVARRVRDIATTYGPMLRLLWHIDRTRRRIQNAPNARAYSDLAIAPIGAGVDQELELFQTSDAARGAAARAAARASVRLAAAAR